MKKIILLVLIVSALTLPLVLSEELKYRYADGSKNAIAGCSWSANCYPSCSASTDIPSCMLGKTAANNFYIEYNLISSVSDKIAWSDPITGKADLDSDNHISKLYGGNDCIDSAADCSIYSGDVKTACEASPEEIYSGATEVCNGIDDDCNGVIDNGYNIGLECLEGVGACETSGIMVCNLAGDDVECNAVPGQPSAEQCNNIDDDCDGTVDGITRACSLNYEGICGVGDETCSSGLWAGCPAPKTEICNNLDDDCDGTIDEGDFATHTYYLDADQDGYAYSFTDNLVVACIAPNDNYRQNPTSTTLVDCNDGNATVHPGATEVCNGVDDDCDGQVDEGVSFTFYRDYDKDGYGNATNNKTACAPSVDWVANKNDCDDNNNLINPKAVERICDGKNNDCNATTPDEPVGIKCANILRDCRDIGGNESDKTLFTCSPPTSIVPARVSDPANSNLECCTGTLISKEFETYWSRQTSGYVKLLGAAEGDYIYCVVRVVRGASGPVNIKIDKAGDTLSGPNSPVVNGIAKYPVIADKIGTYKCNGTLVSNPSKTNSSYIKVTESGVSTNALPFFGMIQFIVALFAVIAYCSWRKNGKLK